jgi:hypothetical protein
MRKHTHKPKKRQEGGFLCMNVNITKQKIQLVKKTANDHLTMASMSYVKTNKAT